MQFGRDLCQIQEIEKAAVFLSHSSLDKAPLRCRYTCLADFLQKKHPRQMDENKKPSVNKLHGLVAIPVGLGTAGQASKIAPFPFVNSPWAGSAFIGAIGLLGVIYLFRKRVGLRSWAIILCAFVADTFLTTYLFSKYGDAALKNPLTLWPYVLGTSATLVVALPVGFFRPKAPILHCCGFVTCDLVFASVLGLWNPLPLIFRLFSRVVALYGAGIVGGLIGKYCLDCRDTIKHNRESVKKAIGKCLAKSAREIIVAVMAGLLVEILK